MIRAFVHRLPQRIMACYSGYRWLWHVLAAALTAVFVFSGFDWWFFEQTRHAWLEPLVFVAGIGGFFVPVVSVGLYWVGEWRKKPLLARTGAAMAQATVIALGIVAVYKAFTGRIQPEFLTNYSLVDISNNFNFGILKHGIFWGWPSSHAAAAVAGATVLFLFWPNRAARIAAIVWAAIVCAGAGIGFHWFSDVVAGVIVGALAGYVVWKDDTIVAHYDIS